jgi:Chorismate synthase
LVQVYRLSHAGATYDAKYGIRNWQGGGRSSASETIGHVRHIKEIEAPMITCCATMPDVICSTSRRIPQENISADNSLASNSAKDTST